MVNWNYDHCKNIFVNAGGNTTRFVKTYKALSIYFLNAGVARFPLRPKLHVACLQQVKLKVLPQQPFKTLSMQCPWSGIHWNLDGAAEIPGKLPQLGLCIISCSEVLIWNNAVIVLFFQNTSWVLVSEFCIWTHQGDWHCYKDEDFIGEVKSLAQQVHRNFSKFIVNEFLFLSWFVSFFLQWLVFPVLINCWWSMIIEHLRKCIGNPHVHAMAASGKTPTAEPHHFQMRKSKFHVFRCSGFLWSRIGLEISNVNVGT